MSQRGPSRTQSILLLVLLGGLVWLWLAREEAVPVFDSSGFGAPDDFDPVRLIYESKGERVVVERRPNGTYWVTAPFEDVASATRIEQAIATTRDLKVLRAIPDTNRASFGLVRPHHRFTAEDAAGRRWTIAVGDSSPVNTQVYAQLESTPEGGIGRSEIFLLREFGARRDFYPGNYAIRQPVPLPIESPIVDSVHVETREYRLRAQRVAKDDWRSLEPAGLRLDPLPINRAIRNLRSPVLREYPEEVDRSEAGLDPPRATWTIFRQGKTDTLHFGHPIGVGETAYVIPAGRSFVATMSSDFYRDYVDGWPRLAERELFSVDPDSVLSVEFIDAEGEGSYRRADGVWKRSPGDSLVTAQDALTRDLENLLELRWTDYPPEAPVSPSGSSLRLSITTAARAETLEIRFAEGNSEAWATSSHRQRWGPAAPQTYGLWQYRSSHPGM